MQRCRAKRVLFSFRNLEKSFFKALTTVIFVAALLFLAPSTPAAEYYWSVTSGDWSVASNWGGTEPTSGGTAYINNGDTASITASGETCDRLYLGQAAGNTGSVSMTSGGLSTSMEYVGYSGSGSVNQIAGTHSISNYLYLSYNSSSTGSYDLSGGQLATINAYIGFSGRGSFSQSDGTHTIGGTLYLGKSSGSTGDYALSGGLLKVSDEAIGYSGTGSFTQSDGTHTIRNSISLGYSSGSTGNYTLNGGQLTASYEDVGQFGRGIFTQSSGTHTVTGALYLGRFGGSSGVYTLNSGQLTVGSEYISYSGLGTFTQSGGTHTVCSTLDISGYSFSTGSYTLSSGQLTTNEEYVGHSSRGTFTQFAGIHTIGGTLNIGYNSESTGSYALNSGQLTVGTEYIGYYGLGTFTQSDGTQTISNSLYLGYYNHATGNYTLSGGRLTACSEYLGYWGKGSFTQLAGVHTVSFLSIGSMGKYTLAGGTLNLTGFDSSGIFDVAGSTATINACSAILDFSNNMFANAKNAIVNFDSHSLLIVPSGFVSPSYFNLNGALVHQTGSTLTLSSGIAIFGSGSIDDFVDCAGGTLTATSNYGITLNGDVHVSDTGNVDLGNGTLYVNKTTSGIGGGQLAANVEYIGYLGSGAFTQTGGTHTIGGTLYLGYKIDLNHSGSYTLSGGQLTTGQERIGNTGTGTFTQSGGTHTIGGTLYLGYSSSSTGSYALNSGQLTVGTEYIGYYGLGTFTQSGGTHSISENFYLGCTTSSGSYALSGGLLMAGSEHIGETGKSTFTQLAGVNAVLFFSLGSSGTYLLTGGTLNLNGFDNSGLFDIAGSTATINARSAIFDLTGGTFSNAQNAVINFDSHSLLIVPSGFSLPSNFNLNGALVHQTGTTLTLSSGCVISGTGSIDDFVDCVGGTLAATSNCSITLKRGVHISDSGNADIGKGILSVNNATSGISSGQLTANAENIGSGTFSQSGGTNFVSYSLVLGSTYNSTGTYNLEGGKLILKSLSKGSGTAQFNFGGGTLQASGTMTTAMLMTLTGTGGNAKVDTAGYAVTLSGAMTGIGGLEKLGGGTLTLAAQNSYSGDTVVQAGTLKITGGIGDEGTSLLDIQAGNALFQTTNIVKSDFTVKTVAGTTFEIVGGTHQIGNLTGAGDVIVDAGSRLTIIDAVNMTGGKITVQNGAGIVFGTPYSADHLYTVSGSHVQMIDDDLGGAGGLEKRGAGTLILDGNNTYLGKTTVSSGILQITGGCTLEGKITVADGAGIVFGSPYSVSTAPESTVGGAALSLDPPYTLQNTAGQASSGTEKLSAISLTGSSGGTAQSLSHPTVATSEIVAVPEPGTWVLLVVSLFSGATVVWKKR